MVAARRSLETIAAIAVVINLAVATYWLAGALHVMGVTTTGATIVHGGAGLFHALVLLPPIFALLALAIVPSSRRLWMLALLLNGAAALVALVASVSFSATANVSSLFFWILFTLPAVSATVALARAGRRAPSNGDRCASTLQE